LIRHITILKFAPDGFDRYDEWTRTIEAYRGAIPGLVGLVHGPDLELVVGQSSGDYVIVSDFADAASLTAYYTHPLHEASKRLSFPRSSQIITVDLALPN